MLRPARTPVTRYRSPTGTEAWSEVAGHRAHHRIASGPSMSGRPLSSKMAVCLGEASCADRSTPQAWSTEVLPVVAQAVGLSVYSAWRAHDGAVAGVGLPGTPRGRLPGPARPGDDPFPRVPGHSDRDR